MSACKVKNLRSSKIWSTLRQPMKQPRLNLNESMVENAERLHYDLRKLIKEGNEKDLEHFAELLDAAKEENAEVAREADASNAVKAGATTGGESSERTLTATIRTTPLPTSEFVALRTVPVYYLNGDIAAELGLEGTPHELTVTVLNDNQERLDTTVVEFTISSCDGKVSKLASAQSHRKHASGGLKQTQAQVDAP
ncbi:unnamed protein product [Porites lobata]|uniref:Uncharacterized protein n=1 Tax=Porites lobata TaxID=104759 RepID=A0ABN8P714_9CNID|nr:unnamed protein product [Porites lobata]